MRAEHPVATTSRTPAAEAPGRRRSARRWGRALPWLAALALPAGAWAQTQGGGASLPLVIGQGAGGTSFSVPIQTLLFFTALGFLPAGGTLHRLDLRITDIAALPHLGPASRAMLAGAGIVDVPQLRRLGAVAAFARVRARSPRASLNLLWALHGALTGVDWRQVAREDRTTLLLALEDHEGHVRDR